MRIAKFLRSLFTTEQRITLAEARAEAKAAYLNEDLAGAAMWNEIIAKMVSSADPSILSSRGHRRAPQPVK